MVLTKWDNCYQRYVQSAFRNTEEAITNISVVGFNAGVQKVLLSEGEVLHIGFFFFILTECNSGPSNNIKKDEVYIFLVFTYWYVLMMKESKFSV